MSSSEEQIEAQVTDNKNLNRFELELGTATAFIEYREESGALTMTHTEVPPEFAGQGVGGKLVKGALEIVKTDGKKIHPQCSFVAGYIQKHPEYQFVVAE